jgi:hypothetical protein
MQDGMIYRINYVSGGGPLRVSEAIDTVWEAEIQPANL